MFYVRVGERRTVCSTVEGSEANVELQILRSLGPRGERITSSSALETAVQFHNYARGGPGGGGHGHGLCPLQSLLLWAGMGPLPFQVLRKEDEHRHPANVELQVQRLPRPLRV